MTQKMKTGYVTYFMYSNCIEGVTTRRMLNAPISMNFKHTLRSYHTQNRLDLRNMIERTVDWMPGTQTRRYKSIIRLRRYGINCEKWLDVSDDLSKDVLNLQLNQVADFLVKESKLIIKNALMREYNRQTLHCYTRNRGRFLTYGGRYTPTVYDE
jgi:hypothetical protein